MQFLYPGFLWALTALAIPIILHLFYFRRYKKVLFSNVRFLREVKEETSARNRLRNLLILLMRLLAIAALVFAFAQPFIPTSQSVKQGKKSVSVFIDNSFSMNSFGQDLTLLDNAKQRAEQIVAAYSDEDEVQILTHDLFTRQQRFLSKEDALGAIEEIDFTPEVNPLSTVFNRQKQLFDQSRAKNPVSFMISDFQENISDLPAIVDTSIDMNLVPLQSVREKNVSIDSAWFDAPVQMLNQTNLLMIKLTNFSNDDADNIKLSMEIDGQEKPIGAVSIPAGESLIDSANITILKTGWHKVIIRITDFPVQFDDSYYLTFYVDEEVQVLAINQSGVNRNLDAVFQNNSYFTLDNQNLGNINYSTFSSYDLIVIDNVTSVSSGLGAELKKYMTGGGKVLFFPGASNQPSAYNSFFTSIPANTFGPYVKKENKVSGINTDEFIFRDVFEGRIRNIRLPTVQGYYPVTKLQGRGEERIMSFRDGFSFISKYVVGNGQFLVCSAPLDNAVNDLVKNAEIFVPLLYKAAIATNESKPVSYTIGREAVIDVENPSGTGEQIFSFVGKSEFIPGMYPIGQRMLLDVKDQVKEAGFFELRLSEDPIGQYAFNFDRKESNLEYLNQDELSNRYPDRFQIWNPVAEANFTQLIGEKDRGIILWRWCIILALIFLAFEILIIRLWKT